MAFSVSHGSVELWLSVSDSVLQCGSVWLSESHMAVWISVAFSLWQCLAVWLGIGLTGVKNRRQLYGRDKKVIQSDQDYDDDSGDYNDSDDDDGDNNMMMRLYFMRIYIYMHTAKFVCQQFFNPD